LLIRKQTVLLLTALWTIRLAYYLFYRNHGQVEDWRYNNMRKSIGKNFPLLSLFYIFLLQAILNFIVGHPLYDSQRNNHPWNTFDTLGVVIFIIGFLFESIGDYQLMKFKSNPVNKGEFKKKRFFFEKPDCR